MRLEVVTILIRFSAVEDRAFEFEPAISEAGREYPKTNVRRILQVMRQRSQWFEKMADAYLVLWWIPAGTIPTVGDAKARLDMLRRDGPTSEAFTFRSPFPAPDASDTDAPADDDWFCTT